MNTITPYEALMLCFDAAGGTQEALGAELGCTQQSVSKMLQSAKRMSQQFVLIAEQKFNVSRHDLRPDIYPRTATMVASLHNVQYFGAGRRSPTQKARAS